MAAGEVFCILWNGKGGQSFEPLDIVVELLVFPPELFAGILACLQNLSG